MYANILQLKLIILFYSGWKMTSFHIWLSGKNLLLHALTCHLLKETKCVLVGRCWKDYVSLVCIMCSTCIYILHMTLLSITYHTVRSFVEMGRYLLNFPGVKFLLVRGLRKILWNLSLDNRGRGVVEVITLMFYSLSTQLHQSELIRLLALLSMEM